MTSHATTVCLLSMQQLFLHLPPPAPNLIASLICKEKHKGSTQLRTNGVALKEANKETIPPPSSQRVYPKPGISFGAPSG